MSFLRYLANMYLFKVNNRNTRKRCEICLKLNTPECCQWQCSGVFIVIFEHIPHLFLEFLLLNLIKQMFAVNVLRLVFQYHFIIVVAPFWEILCDFFFHFWLILPDKICISNTPCISDSLHHDTNLCRLIFQITTREEWVHKSEFI